MLISKKKNTTKTQQQQNNIKNHNHNSKTMFETGVIIVSQTYERRAVAGFLRAVGCCMTVLDFSLS